MKTNSNMVRLRKENSLKFFQNLSTELNNKPCHETIYSDKAKLFLSIVVLYTIRIFANSKLYK